MKGDNLFWMQFRVWFKRKLERGEYTSFTLKRLFEIYKKDYLPAYIRDKNGLHHAYLEMVTFEDVSRTLWWRIVNPLLNDKIIIKTGRKKWAINRCDRMRNFNREIGKKTSKTPIHEVGMEGD